MPAPLPLPSRTASVSELLDAGSRIWRATLPKCLPLAMIAVVAAQCRRASTAGVSGHPIANPLRAAEGSGLLGLLRRRDDRLPVRGQHRDTAATRAAADRAVRFPRSADRGGRTPAGAGGGDGAQLSRRRRRHDAAGAAGHLHRRVRVRWSGTWCCSIHREPLARAAAQRAARAPAVVEVLRQHPDRAGGDRSSRVFVASLVAGAAAWSCCCRPAARAGSAWSQAAGVGLMGAGLLFITAVGIALYSAASSSA